MMRQYLNIILQSMSKNLIFIAINILGMSISIGCCIVAYYNYRFNADFDRTHKNIQSIYRVSSLREFQQDQKLYGIVPMVLGNLISQNFKDVDKVVRYNVGRLNLKIDDNVFTENIQFADPQFFEVFDFDFIEGDPRGLGDKSQLYISDELALKLFNSTKVVGRIISWVYNEDSLSELQIGGIFRKPPMNSSFSFNAVTNFNNYLRTNNGFTENSWYEPATVFVLIKEKSRMPNIEKQLQSYCESNNKIRSDFLIKTFVLDPFEGMAVRDRKQGTEETWTRAP